MRHCNKPKNRAALALAVNIGSVVEEEDEQGLAHVVEHLAFNATEVSTCTHAPCVFPPIYDMHETHVNILLLDLHRDSMYPTMNAAPAALDHPPYVKESCGALRTKSIGMMGALTGTFPALQAIMIESNLN